MPARGTFLRNVLTMMSGTVLAQAIPMAMAPVLTRLYTPTDYGVYAAFMLVAGIIAALASARLEMAIMVPENIREAANIAVFSLLIALTVSVSLLFAVLVFGTWLIDAFAGTRADGWTWLLPPMVALLSVYQVLSYWLLRKQEFRMLSAARVFRAVAIAAANIVSGVLEVPRGLLLSSLIGQAVATMVLAWQALGADRTLLQGLAWSEMKRLFIKHREFPLFALPAELLSTLAGQLPVMLLDKATGGLFAFVQMVVNAPLAVVSGSVLDVFKERATRDYREKGNFSAIFVQLAKNLGLLGLGPAVVLLAFGPPLFALVFGESWRAGGEVARILAVMYFLKLLVSPLSYSYLVVGRQREDFLLHIWIAASTFAVLIWGLEQSISSLGLMGLFSANYSIIYLVYFVRSFAFSRQQREVPS